ncbi:hypothetical protein CPB86DRAFT_533994 [Serendipita vermifera]|nr:hypothetical protein CPB86DRAFT_533994 [Serendipita vermifera]
MLSRNSSMLQYVLLLYVTASWNGNTDHCMVTRPTLPMHFCLLLAQLLAHLWDHNLSSAVSLRPLLRIFPPIFTPFFTRPSFCAISLNGYLSNPVLLRFIYLHIYHSALWPYSCRFNESSPRPPFRRSHGIG